MLKLNSRLTKADSLILCRRFEPPGCHPVQCGLDMVCLDGIELQVSEVVFQIQPIPASVEGWSPFVYLVMIQQSAHGCINRETVLDSQDSVVYYIGFKLALDGFSELQGAMDDLGPNSGCRLP